MAKADNGVTGHFTLSIEYEGLEAVLSFSSGTPQDKVWTLADISALAQAAGVTFGHKADEFQKAFNTCIQKKEKQFSLVYAKGITPVSTVPEEIQAVESPVPDAWKDAVQDVLAHAPEPHIQREVQEKVEKTRVVASKGALPFLPGKEEVVKVVEKVSRFEKVEVDSRVLSYAWYDEGAKIGQILPSKPGTPGKTVKGEVLQPPSPPETTVMTGGNVSRKGADLTAMSAGIARFGKGWVDLIPFTPHGFNLSVSDDKATLFMDYTPGHQSLFPPSYQDFLTKAAELGFTANDLVPEHDFASCIHDAVREGDRVVRKPMTLPQDAFFDITVSDDKLKAVLNISKGSGHGKALVLKEVGKAINESGIKLGDREKVKKDVLDFFGSSEKALIGYVLAEGKEPQEPPRQTFSLSLEILEKKESEKILAQLSKNPPPILEGFPLDKVSSLSWVQKEQRLGNLGPTVVGAPGVDVMGQVIPGKATPPLELKLCGPIEKSQGFLIAKIRGLAIKAEDAAGALWFAVLEHMDAAFRVGLVADAMAAVLTIEAHRGSGIPVDPVQVKAEIAKLGVKKGLLEAELNQALEAALKGVDQSEVVIARGQEAKSPGNSRSEWLFQKASGQAVRLRADGTADYKNKDIISTVKKGTVLVRVLPPEFTPESGWDVLGKERKPELPAGPGVEAGNNVKVEKQADGSLHYVADCDGELKTDKGKVEIVAAYTIKGNVDSATGNIKFPGPVTIAGDVMGGFYVMSGGDIKINGSVEASLLSADQDIMVQGGIKGAGKALLRSKRHILATFVEYATMLAIGDIKIKKSILRSTVKCNSRILMADDASIIGGEIKVKSGMQLGNLGSENAIPTKVVFGSDILVEDQIGVEEKEIQKLQEQILSVNNAMKQPDKISSKEAMQELFNSKIACMKMLEKRNLRLFSLKERFEQHFPSEIIVKGTVFPGVMFECHGRSLEVHQKKTKIRISFDTSTGKIVEKPIEGKT